MKNYTKDQLISAQLKYNMDFIANPEKFQPDSYMLGNPEKAANEYIEHLLTLIYEVV